MWGGQDFRRARSHIDRKSVDFLLCDSIELKPVLAIEYDDKSHGLEDRMDRDTVVEAIFLEAGLPLLRIPNTGPINIDELSQLVRSKLVR